MDGTRARRLCRRTRGRSACCSRTSRPDSSRPTWDRGSCFPPPISVQILRLLRRPALLEQCDVRPLPLSAFFARLGYRDELPLTPEEAVTRLKGKHVQIEEPTVTAAFPDPVAPVVIEARAVEFVYPSGVLCGHPALDHVDLTVRQGECIAIVGANGSGKTTLAKLLQGLLVPTRGEGPI